MRTALDSNILSALWSSEPHAHQISRMLQEAKGQGSLILSAVAYAELFAHPKTNKDFRNRFIVEEEIEVDFDLTSEIWIEGGRRFADYAGRRRRSGGGQARRLVPDFLIGAHALLRADCLMTTDISRFDRDFPDLKLLVMDEQP